MISARLFKTAKVLGIMRDVCLFRIRHEVCRNRWVCFCPRPTPQRHSAPRQRRAGLGFTDNAESHSRRNFRRLCWYIAFSPLSTHATRKLGQDVSVSMRTVYISPRTSARLSIRRTCASRRRTRCWYCHRYSASTAWVSPNCPGA